ncbi:MAG TPA: DNA polymerase, partial [Steroidobacteraceae bacterium]
MSHAPDLVLVDGSSYLYRAFHALPPLTTSRGEPTGAMFGVLNMMLKFMKDYRPQRIAIVFDAAGKTFRDELFSEYKAFRTPMPDNLRPQIEPLFRILRAQGFPLLRIEGVEADDVIGTLACRAARANKQVLISTSDKDMAQLVNGSITLINTMTNTTLDRAGVKAKFDVYPEQIIDYLALVGDSSDNIPGIDKVGPKTAAKLLAQYGSLDGVIAHVNEIEGRVGENLRAGLATLELSRKLATIRTDLDLPVSFEELTLSPPDIPTLRELYTRYEFRALLRQLDETAPAAEKVSVPAMSPDQPVPPAVEKRYETITEWAHFEQWLEKLRNAELFSLNIETTGADYMRAEMVGISFAVEPGVAAYVPLRHDYAGTPKQLDRDRVLEALKPILEDPSRAKLGTDIKFEAHVLLKYGIRLEGMRYDAMLESYVWNSVATKHDLATMSERYLGIRATSYESIAGKGAKQLQFNQVPIEEAAKFASEDADLTIRLHRALWPQITTMPQLQRLYEEIEQPLVPVLLRMEQHGVLVDRDLLRAQSRELAAQLQDLLALARKEAGFDLNIDSPKQLQQVLFEKMQLPVIRKTPSGQPSTAEDVLEELAVSYPLPRIILDYRALAKLKSTYTDKLPEQVNPNTGRIHTCY